MNRHCLWCGKCFEPKNTKRPSNFCSLSHRGLWQWRKGANRKGQKRLLITKEELDDKLNHKLQTIAQIAKSLGISYDTVYRRATEFGLTKGWHKSHGLRIWASSGKVVFVVQVDPEKSTDVRNEMLRLSLNADVAVQVYEPRETWREVRSEMNGDIGYLNQRQRMESLQRIMIAESQTAWEEK